MLDNNINDKYIDSRDARYSKANIFGLRRLQLWMKITIGCEWKSLGMYKEPGQGALSTQEF